VDVRFCAPIQTDPGSHPEVKRSKRGVDHPPHLAPRLKKKSNTPSWAVLGRTLPLPLHFLDCTGYEVYFYVSILALSERTEQMINIT
jgi:hypothetical protein